MIIFQGDRSETLTVRDHAKCVVHVIDGLMTQLERIDAVPTPQSHQSTPSPAPTSQLVPATTRRCPMTNQQQPVSNANAMADKYCPKRIGRLICIYLYENMAYANQCRTFSKELFRRTNTIVEHLIREKL